MTRAGFPHSDIYGSKLSRQLPVAYRSHSRPSSVMYVKAFIVCAYITFYALAFDPVVIFRVACYKQAQQFLKGIAHESLLQGLTSYCWFRTYLRFDNNQCLCPNIYSFKINLSKNYLIVK